MVIEETICITAPISVVWDLFIDLSCWADWNTVLAASTASTTISEGRILKCSIKPYLFPFDFNVHITEVIPKRKVTWKSKKYGITSIHEFFFEEISGGVVVRSREEFSGHPLLIFSFIFPEKKIRMLNRNFLNDLKNASEASHDRKD